jgi:cytochrome c556
LTKTFLVAVGLIAAATCAAGAQTSPDPVVMRRVSMALMDGNFANIRAVVAARGDVRRLGYPARTMARYAAFLPGLFPPGSETGSNTKALPEVFSKPDAFKAAAEAFGQAATALASATGSGDLAVVEAAVRAVDDSCTNCHRAFRGR